MKKPSYSKIRKSQEAASKKGITEKECERCGHPYIVHSWGLLGPCFWNRSYDEGSEGSIGDKMFNECDCIRFEDDEFVKDVEKIRKEVKNGK